MIRLIFTMFVTCALLLFAGVWVARDRTPESLASAIVPVLERTRELAKQIPRLLPELEPAPPVARTIQELTPEEIDQVIEAGVEERLASLREREFVEAPLEAEPDVPETGAAAAEASDAAFAADGEVSDEEPPDQEQWAALIRRMLAVYQQVGRR